MVGSCVLTQKRYSAALALYANDFALACRSELSQQIWREICDAIKIEPPGPLSRFLGCVRFERTQAHTRIEFGMEDCTIRCFDAYLSILPAAKPQKVATPSLDVQDFSFQKHLKQAKQVI